MKCVLSKIKSFLTFIVTGQLNTRCKQDFYHEFNKISTKTEQIKSIEIFNKMQLQTKR